MKWVQIALLAFFPFACKSYSHFTTPNDVYRAEGIVRLIDGQELPGKITVQFETGHAAANELALTRADGLVRKIILDSIAYYRVGKNEYCPKQADMEAFSIPYRDKQYDPKQRNLLFVKRLTAENARMGFYELFESRNKASDGLDHYYYFVSLPGDGRLTMWSVGSSKFLPRFDEKMSKLLADCPELANKIALKDDRYNLGQISLETKKYAVFARIVEAYNKCR